MLKEIRDKKTTKTSIPYISINNGSLKSIRIDFKISVVDR